MDDREIALRLRQLFRKHTGTAAGVALAQVELLNATIAEMKLTASARDLMLSDAQAELVAERKKRVDIRERHDRIQHANAELHEKLISAHTEVSALREDIAMLMNGAQEQERKSSDTTIDELGPACSIEEDNRRVAYAKTELGKIRGVTPAMHAAVEAMRVEAQQQLAVDESVKDQLLDRTAELKAAHRRIGELDMMLVTTNEQTDAIHAELHAELDAAQVSLAEANEVLGAICVLAATQQNERVTVPSHAAIDAMLYVLDERDKAQESLAMAAALAHGPLSKQ